MGQLSLSSARQARTAAGAHPAALSLGRSSARRNDRCRRSTPLEHRLGTQSHRPSSSGLYLGSSPYPSASRGRRSMSWSYDANSARRDAVCCAVMEASWTRPRLHRIDLSACRTCLQSHRVSPRTKADCCSAGPPDDRIAVTADDPACAAHGLLAATPLKHALLAPVPPLERPLPPTPLDLLPPAPSPRAPSVCTLRAGEPRGYRGHWRPGRCGEIFPQRAEVCSSLDP